MRSAVVALLLFVFVANVQAQVKSVDSLETKYLNWHNLDNATNAKMGTGVDKVWAELLQNRKAKKTIIVAVIDSGIDINHEDLKESIWVNEDEIANNNIDDDNNGYVDDIHGWNFIGNSKGENINKENMEYTRIYRAGESHPDYTRAKEKYRTELKKRQEEKDNLIRFEAVFLKSKAVIKEKTGITVKSLSDLEGVDGGQDVMQARNFLKGRYEAGLTDAILKEIIDNNNDYLRYFLNLNFDARKVIGDNPAELGAVYGNPDVQGPRANHGTAVAGVIAAKRNNGLGIDGIIPDVKIMCVRSTPDGDERDKDVSLAIRYAVDNGAQIINMSFGKAFSPEKHLVDAAVKYAEQKNVLLVHAAGNDGRNIDVEESYPSDKLLDKSEVMNWLSVGASDERQNETLAAPFSNYGEHQVDLFAPGVNIITLDQHNTYSKHDGTSLAAPVVSGVAALVLSYHPELTPSQLIDVLLQSSTKMDKLKVNEPGTEKKKKVKFKDLSKSGGVLNAFDALKLADQLHPN
jgi:subtilisin family serine protease